MIHSLYRSLKISTVLLTNITTIESIDGKNRIEIDTPDLNSVNKLRELIVSISNKYFNDNDFWLYLDTTLHVKNFNYELVK